MTLAQAEREVLLATLRHCGGNKRRTAEMLGVSVKTVYNKLVGERGASSAPPRIDPVLQSEGGREMKKPLQITPILIAVVLLATTGALYQRYRT